MNKIVTRSRRARRAGAVSGHIEPLETRRLLSASPTSAPTPSSLGTSDRLLFQPLLRPLGSGGAFTQATGFMGYIPSQIRSYYGMNQVSFGATAANGAGQTIAIIDLGDDPFIASDLATFDGAMNLPAPPSFSVIAQDGSSNLPPPSTDTAEESMDVEWAHAMAPAASIVVLEANVTSYATLSNALVTAVDTAKNLPGVSIVSMSLGVPEQLYHAPDSAYTTPSGHEGVTFIASSGDGGAFPKGSTQRDIIVNSPASSPNVLSIGGTTLNIGSSTPETGWGYVVKDGSFWGSGGGISTLESRPSYQANVAVSSAGRNVPDVSFVADPNTGVRIYDTLSGGWGVEGGTSLGAPAWAGILAVVNQGRALQGLPTLNSPSDPTLPAIYQLPSSDFLDITSGNNGVYNCTNGYDLVTGRGSPILGRLIPDLVGKPTGGLPDLKPYTPTGWSGPVVVTNSASSLVNASTITTSDTVYVDAAFINSGTATVSVTYSTTLQLDGKTVFTITAGPTDPVNTYFYKTGINLGSLSAGQHTLTMTIDSGGKVTESDKGNNTYTRTFTVTTAGLPDLAPYTPANWSAPLVVTTSASSTTDALNLLPTSTIYLDAAFINQGAATINQSFSSEIELNGKIVATIPTPPPLQATFYYYDKGISLGKLAAGTYTLKMLIDSGNAIAESNESNNAYTRTFVVAGSQLPDLAPYAPTGWSSAIVTTTSTGSTANASTITTSQPVYVDWAAQNLGKAPTADTFYTTLSLDGKVVSTWYTTPPLYVNYYTTVRDYALGKLSAGTHTLTLSINYDHALAESSYGNNTYTRTFTVTSAALPDLAPFTPSGWSAPVVATTVNGAVTSSLITAGQPVYVDWAIYNVGKVSTTATFTTELLLDGQVKQSWTTAPPLQPTYYTHITGYSLGPLSAGSHTLEILINSTKSVLESSYANDSYTLKFTVAAAALPDLAPFKPSGWSAPIVATTTSGSTVSAAITTADTVYVDWAVQNEGSADTAATFTTQLLLDGSVINSWTTSPPLQAAHYAYVSAYNIGTLGAGNHTLKIVINSTSAVAESNYSNNTFTLNFSVTNAGGAIALGNYVGTAVTTVTTTDGLNTSFSIPETVVLAKPIVDAPANQAESNPFDISIGANSGYTGTNGDFEFSSALPLDPAGIGPVLLQYWSYSASGNSFSGRLASSGANEAAAPNLIYLPEDLVPGEPQLGVLTFPFSLSDGTTGFTQCTMTGSVTNGKLHLVISGQAASATATATFQTVIDAVLQ